MCLLKLRHKVRGTLNRSCNELREEADEERVEEDVFFGLDIAAIYVDNVGESLERVE